MSNKCQQGKGSNGTGSQDEAGASEASGAGWVAWLTVLLRWHGMLGVGSVHAMVSGNRDWQRRLVLRRGMC